MASTKYDWDEPPLEVYPTGILSALGRDCFLEEKWREL